MSLLPPDRAADLLRAIERVRVLVVGDLMLDRYVAGPVGRISPEAPVPVVRVEREWVALGGAGNVAANVTTLAAACAVIGCVGDDPEGETLTTELAAAGVDASGVVSDPTRPTTVKTRVRAQAQQIVRFDREAEHEVEGRVAKALEEAIVQALPECDAVVVQDYDKGVLASRVIDTIRSAGAARGVPLVVDPKRRSFFSYGGATVFKPNRRELEDALGEDVHPEDAEWMESVRSRLDCDHLLLTLGDDGMSLQTSGAPLVRLPADSREVFDVSGAGDTVSGVVAAALGAGASVCEAAALANHAAAVEVQRPGIRTVKPAEVLAHVEAVPTTAPSKRESP